jgi:hypothetical protein
MVLFQKIHASLQLSWICQTVAKKPLCFYKLLSFRKYYFQKLTQFSQRNNVLDASGSNTDGFPWRDTCVFSPQPNRPIWNNMSQSSPGILWYAGTIPLRNLTILTWKQWPRCYSLKPTRFPLERYMSFFNLSEQAYWQLKAPFCTLKRYNDLQEELSKTNCVPKGQQGTRRSCFQQGWVSFWDTCVSSSWLNVCLWNKMILAPRWKPCLPGRIPFQPLLNSRRQTMCWVLLPLIPTMLFCEINVLHQLRQIGLHEQNEPFSTLKTMICKECFFKNSLNFQRENVC